MGVHEFQILNPPSHIPPHTIPLGHPSASAPSTLYHASNLVWRCISHMIIYMFQCHSPKSSHPRPLPQSPKTVLYICVSFAVSYTGLLAHVVLKKTIYEIDICSFRKWSHREQYIYWGKDGDRYLLTSQAPWNWGIEGILRGRHGGGWGAQRSTWGPVQSLKAPESWSLSEGPTNAHETTAARFTNKSSVTNLQETNNLLKFTICCWGNTRLGCRTFSQQITKSKRPERELIWAINIISDRHLQEESN